MLLNQLTLHGPIFLLQSIHLCNYFLSFFISGTDLLARDVFSIGMLVYAIITMVLVPLLCILQDVLRHFYSIS